MKTLLLLRHGKSDWDAPFGSDAERPLAKRGVKSAQLMGKFLTTAGVAPDLALTSPAVRARSTLELAAVAGGWEATRRIEAGLYDGSAVAITELVRRTPYDVGILLLTGHQPTWGTLTSQLIGGGRIAFPTAAVACIDLPVPRWQDVGPGRGELRWFIPPRLIQGGSRPAESR